MSLCGGVRFSFQFKCPYTYKYIKDLFCYFSHVCEKVTTHE